MPRPRPAFKLSPGPKRWILDTLKVNDLPRRKTKTPGTTKRISLPRVLLMHHQVGPNPLWHSPRKNRTVVLTKEDLDDRAKARILLLLVSMPPPSGKTRIKTWTKKTYPTLSATLANKKAIMPTSVPRKSQKTSVSLDDLYVGD